MWLILLEAFVALSLLLLIVWSTWPRQDEKKMQEDELAESVAQGARGSSGDRVSEQQPPRVSSPDQP